MTPAKEKKTYAILLAVTFMAAMGFFVFGYIQRMRLQAETLIRIEMEKRYQMGTREAERLMVELDSMRQTLREKDSVISALTKKTK